MKADSDIVNNRSIGDVLDYLTALRANRPSVTLSKGRSPKGGKTIAQILSAARIVFIRDGYGGVSLRKIAKEAGLALGNVSYYFPTKQALVSASLQEAMADYIGEFYQHLQLEKDTPIDVLLNAVTFYVRNSRSSYPFFFQLWGYAATSPEAKQLIRELYQPIDQFIFHLVRACNPALDEQETRKAVFQIFSMEQGMKLTIGMGHFDDVRDDSAEQTIRDATKRLVCAA